MAIPPELRDELNKQEELRVSRALILGKLQEAQKPDVWSEGVTPVSETKQLRKDLDEVIQKIKGSPRKSAERTLALRKVQEAVMWLGMDLKDLNEPNPYPESYNPASPKIEPVADGLKL